MPGYYIFICDKCNYRADRYRNVKRCPDCGGNLTREQPERVTVITANPAYTVHISVVDDLARILGMDRVYKENVGFVWKPHRQPDLEAAAKIINEVNERRNDDR